MYSRCLAYAKSHGVAIKKKMKAVDFTCELQNFPKFHTHDHLQVLSGLKANDPPRLIYI